MGPAKDITGFEQGGLNSGDFYKNYNNEQLKTAQKSELGVNLKSTTISAIGDADDVILASNDIYSLKLLAQLTESYCLRFRVKLVSSKTKLLPIYNKNHQLLVNYAEIINPVTINGTKVEFSKEADHVGVIRSIAGNMPNIVNRISSHKKALGSVSSVGLARNHRGNPAATLRVQQMYGTPVLFSGLACLVLSKPEVNVIETHFKNTLQNLQKLHQNTPRCVVYFMAGSLPAEAILHLRQLGLFSMITRLQTDPLNVHARYTLTNAPTSAKSWFQQICELYLRYHLPHPLQLLDFPPTKEGFKNLVKLKVLDFWQEKLRSEAKTLKSLQYFKPDYYSLSNPHRIWSAAGSDPYESSKSFVIAKMISGRYRTEDMCRFWSNNRNGYCQAPTCKNIVGDLKHLLLQCLALEPSRARLLKMWKMKTDDYPGLQKIIARVLSSSEDDQVQFILDPTVFPDMISLVQENGRSVLDHALYLTRTFAFYLHKQSLILLGRWPNLNNDKPTRTNTTKEINQNHNTNTILFPGIAHDPDSQDWSIHPPLDRGAPRTDSQDHPMHAPLDRGALRTVHSPPTIYRQHASTETHVGPTKTSVSEQSAQFYPNPIQHSNPRIVKHATVAARLLFSTWVCNSH